MPLKEQKSLCLDPVICKNPDTRRAAVLNMCSIWLLLFHATSDCVYDS